VQKGKILFPFTHEQILAWADAYYERTGRWPTRDSGPIEEAPDETWLCVEAALTRGVRGLPGGFSLARLLAEQRGRRNQCDLPALQEERILAWADAHAARTGKWPTARSGPIAEAPGETWNAVKLALARGTRGLSGGSSLAQLLEERRGVPSTMNRPPLTVEQILAWADAHHARTGQWPKRHSGAIEHASHETWSAVDGALLHGHRRLPGGFSLARLLMERRGVQCLYVVPELSVGRILAWADAYHARHGRWPNQHCGVIEDTPAETWARVNTALAQGNRGLPGGSSLAKLLAQHRGIRNQTNIPQLTIAQILAWADAHYERTGAWPTGNSGPAEAAAGENWEAIDLALRKGSRGLPAGGSLSRLLAEKRGHRNLAALPPLTQEQILAWADACFARRGTWPNRQSGPIEDAPGEIWSAVSAALDRGSRGLPGGFSLPRLLAEHRNVRNNQDLPSLTVEQILAWADAHQARTGVWPTAKRGGPVAEAPGEHWQLLDVNLRQGLRGLPAGLSLARLLARERGVRNRKDLPPHTEAQILRWAEAHCERTGQWPKGSSGPITDAPGETWAGVDAALATGIRGLPGGSSLARLPRTRHGGSDIASPSR
jgi:hypothetical protein